MVMSGAALTTSRVMMSLIFNIDPPLAAGRKSSLPGRSAVDDINPAGALLHIFAQMEFRSERGMPEVA
jgi:hypothetical protein